MRRTLPRRHMHGHSRSSLDCDRRLRDPNGIGAGRLGLAALARIAAASLLAMMLQPSGVTFADALDAESIVIPPARSQPRHPDGPVYRVRRFEVVYEKPDPVKPALDDVLPMTVALVATPSGYVAPRAETPAERIVITGEAGETTLFHASAIGAISKAIVAEIHERGLLGVYVQPDPTDIDPSSESDQRATGDLDLRFLVWTGRVKAVRTIGIGKRIRDDWTVNNRIHERIRTQSPIQPEHIGPTNATDLVRSDRLEDYLYRLNRHPGRYVEAALSAAEKGEGVSLDYRVHESRPWSIYAQTSNTGTTRTSLWQTRLGVINRQLFGRDDILTMEYMNSGLDKVNGGNFSYEAPWFYRERPSWLKKSGFEPRWISWLDRDKIPWWGCDRLRWSISGATSKIYIDPTADMPDSQFGSDEFETRDWHLEGRFILNALQYRNFFLDTYAGVRRRNVQVDDLTSDNDGSAQLLMGDLGIRFERINEYSTLLGTAGAVLGSTDSNLEFLGRNNADDRWNALYWDIGFAHYLEPLFNPKGFRDPSTAWTSTLAHELAIGVRGQYAFDYRLLPQASQIVGGLYTVRGFEQGIAVGDSVYVGTVAYRFHLPRALPIKRRPMDLPLLGDFRVTPQQVYGRPDWDFILSVFADAGRAVRNQRSEAISTSESNQTLVSAGVGIEAIFRGNIRARVDWARGLYYDVDQYCKPTNGATCPYIDDSIDKSGMFNFVISVIY